MKFLTAAILGFIVFSSSYAHAQITITCRGVSCMGEQDITMQTERAERGDVEAQWTLGLYFESKENRTGAIQYTQAAEWYRKAADQGYSSAEKKLGLLYSKGLGVEQSYAEAYFWHSLALKAEYNGKIRENIIAERDGFSLYLKLEEIQALNKRVREWKPKVTETAIATECPLSPSPDGKSQFGDFANLKAVALYVELFPREKLERSLECHGKERECVAQQVEDGQRDDYIKMLKRYYDVYREPLHADNLIRVFKDRVRENVLAFLTPDKTCRVPDVIVFDGNDPEFKVEQFFDFIAKKDVLVFNLKVSFFDSGEQAPINSLNNKSNLGVAAVSWSAFQPGVNQFYQWLEFKNPPSVIPLDLSNEEISNRLRKIAGSYGIERMKITPFPPEEISKMEADWLSKVPRIPYSKVCCFR